jgi:hypothetical protein
MSIIGIFFSLTAHTGIIKISEEPYNTDPVLSNHAKKSSENLLL